MWDQIMTVLPTVLVALALAALVFFIIRSMVRNKKQGKSSCSCGCGGCPMRESCHTKK